MGGADKKKKIAVAGLASILLVAMCVAVAVGVTRKSGGGDAGSSSNTGGGGGSGGGVGVSASTKAVQTICAPTDYKETCEKSLSNANTTEPKELIKVAFNAAMENIGGVLKQSTLLKEAASDESTKDAYSVCEEVLEDAVEDLKRSADKVGEIDPSKVNEYVEDVRTWLSAVITYQETCIDAFENVTGDTGEKMRNLLQTARELSSNGLAMVTDISSILSSLQLGNVGSRRLLSEEGRELYFKDPTDYAPGEEPHYSKHARHLLSAWRPNAVVAQDGSGHFRKINDAIARVPKKNAHTFVIYVKAGVYRENVIVPKGAHKIVLIGDGPLRTRITGNKCFAKGTKTFQSATVAINADDFVAKNIAFENTAGPQGHQAVALRVSGDRAVFFNVHIDGYQDSLYAHTYRQFYRDCSISGTIDFIFGDALSIFQNCKFIVRKPMAHQACMVTAQGRVDPRSQGAIVIQNGDIQAEPAFLATRPAIQAYLGRPWKQLSRTIIMQSNIGGFIAPEGWSPWMGDFALNTLYYAEFQNRGPGSDLRRRVHWRGIRHIDAKIANSFTGGKAFGGDWWVRAAAVPYVPTLMRV